ncbi:MAG: oligopeptide:H+ symporter [Pirellulaceae bacterium]|nr:oligopeptide:H+ symporter [Pirellulaceae bacterium]
MNDKPTEASTATLFGHPTGLFVLFFAELWERFSFYGMRALLMFYMIKGFLGLGDRDATAVYGAYTALVYMTPFFGGVLADRLLGTRRAVILGGGLMAAGYLMLMIPGHLMFYTALATLICGNGFFKPNISSLVGQLYPAGSPKRDGGFTIFYIGINLGAAMAPLICGYIGETYGWNYGFGLATLGMLLGLALFVNWLPPDNIGAPPDPARLRQRPVAVTQALVLLGAVVSAVALLMFRSDNWLSLAGNWFVAIALLGSAFVACMALRGGRGGLIDVEWSIYLGTLLSVPVFALLVSGFAPLRSDLRGVTVIPDAVIKYLEKDAAMHSQLDTLRQNVEAPESATIAGLAESFRQLHLEKTLDAQQLGDLIGVTDLLAANRSDEAKASLDELQARHPRGQGKKVLALVLAEASRPAGLVLMLAGLVVTVYLLIETFLLDKIARERMFVVLILTFFSMLFWSFFEQAGSSLNNFTDRNIDRVFESQRVTADQVGKTIELQPTQEQLGFRHGDRIFTIDTLTRLREENRATPDFRIPWKITDEHVGMGIADRVQEAPASTFQSVNPIYILIFGLVFTALWTFMGQMGIEPSTPVKFALGLLQLGLGFGAFWLGALWSDDRGMVSVMWLMVGYLLHTTGELCLSPVGLSMVTRLSPARLVSTVMGAWFLATAFSQLLAAIIAQFTGVSGSEDGGAVVIPPPVETVEIYGTVFGQVALAAIASGVICLLLAPLLSYWMHPRAE